LHVTVTTTEWILTSHAYGKPAVVVVKHTKYVFSLHCAIQE